VAEDQTYKKGLGDPFLMIGEEGLEVAKEVMKAQRFGLKGDPAWTSQPGNSSPRSNIIQEIGDFLYILDALIARDDISVGEVEYAKRLKGQKMAKLFGAQAVETWFYKGRVAPFPRKDK